MLIYDIFLVIWFPQWDAAADGGIVIALAFIIGTLIEIGECREEFHDLRLAKDVWEYAEVMTELLIRAEVHQAFSIGVKLEIWKHCPMNTTQDFDHELIF